MAILYVSAQSGTHQNGSAGSTTAAVSVSPTNGSLVCVSVGHAGATGDTVAVADNATGGTNTYTPADAVFNSGQGYKWYSFYALNTHGSPTTITATVTPSGRTFLAIVADTFSGVAAVGALDGHVMAIQTSITSATAVSTTAVVPAVSGDLIYGSTVDISGAGTVTKASTFTLCQSTASLFNSEYFIQASAASIAATWTHSATDTFTSGLMCFVPITCTNQLPLVGSGCTIDLLTGAAAFEGVRRLQRNRVQTRRDFLQLKR